MKTRNPLCVILVLVVLISQSVQSQEKRERKNIVSASFFGTSPILGFSYERLLSKSFSAEVGVGLIGLGAGVNYYPFTVQERKVNFYTGIKYSYVEDLIIFDLKDQFYDEKLYIPIGINYFSPWNMNFGLDIGPAIVGQGFLGNLKVGFRF